MTSFGYLYQNKVWGICYNLNQLTHLSSASGPNDDVIKMAAKVLLMHIYTCTKVIRFEALVMWEFLAGIRLLSLFDRFGVI